MDYELSALKQSLWCAHLISGPSRGPVLFRVCLGPIDGPATGSTIGPGSFTPGTPEGVIIVRRRLAVGIATVLAVVVTGCGTATTDAAHAAVPRSFQRAARVLPPLNAGTKGFALLSGVSCASAGDCTAVGAYEVPPRLLALAATEANGSWGRAVEVAAPLNALGMGAWCSSSEALGCRQDLNGVSCTSLGTAWPSVNTRTPPAETS
jgi:hypothetical protein